MSSLNYNIEQLVSSLFYHTNEPKKQGSYKPVIIIGLGGSGIRSLRVLKKELLKNKPIEGDSYGVKLLGIDCDINEFDKFPLLPLLDQSEVCLMEAESGTGLLALSKTDPEYAFIQEYLPTKAKGLHAEVRAKIQGGIGAGQFRRAGKLMFAANVRDGVGIKRKLENVRQELIGLTTLMRQNAQGLQIASGTEVYVVSSFAGGTGSGILLDLLALARNIFDGPLDTISVIGLLPGDPLDNELTHPDVEASATRGNAYGILQELNSIMKGEVETNFQFDAQFTIPLRTDANLINAVYLVGDELYGTGKRVPISNWSEIWEAAAYFLYALVGTGIGATRASGAINDMDMEGGFGAVGVGVAKYPVDLMAERAVRMAIEGGCEYWLDTKLDTKDLENLVTGVLSETTLASASMISDNFPTPDSGLISIWKKEHEIKKALSSFKMHDKPFLGQCKTKMRNVDSELRKQSDQFVESRQDDLDSLKGVLDTKANFLATGPYVLAIALFEQLSKHLDSLIDELTNKQKKREQLENRLKDRMVKLESKINFLDWGLDRKYRREYIQKTNSFLQSRADAFIDDHLRVLISQATGIVNGYASKLKSQRTELKGARQRNRDELAKSRIADPSFVLSVYDDDQVRSWCESKRFAEMADRDFDLSNFSVDSLLVEALGPVISAIRADIHQLDLLHDSQKQKDIKASVNTLNLSSNPLLPLAETVRPGMLAPMKTVAGHKIDDTTIKSHVSVLFPAPRRGNTQTSELSDPHTVLCVQTIQGIDITKWIKFGGCESAFLSRHAARQGIEGWRYRTLPNGSGVGPLRKPSETEAYTYSVLARGFMVDAISISGNNYYKNLGREKQEGEYAYLTYSADRSPMGRELILKGIVREAPVRHTRKQKDRRVATSLSDCVAAITRWSDLTQGIDDVSDRLKLAIGAVQLKTMINDFMTSYVDRKIQRGDLNLTHWTKIRTALENYIRDLD
jgi:hypothetical protein